MILVQEHRIKYWCYDITCEPWLLSTDSLNGAPCHFSLDMFWNLELTATTSISARMVGSRNTGCCWRRRLWGIVTCLAPSRRNVLAAMPMLSSDGLRNCNMFSTPPSPLAKRGSLIPNQAFPFSKKGKDVAGDAIALPEFWYRQRSLCPKGNHLYFHTPSEPPLFKGDSRDVKNKKGLDLTFISV